MSFEDRSGSGSGTGSGSGSRSGSASGEDVRRQLLASAPIPERRLELAGVSTPILEGGDGPPVVLLHGPGAYGSGWLPVVPELIRSYRVIAPDLPGHGASVLTGDGLDASRVLGWLGELLEQTCNEPPVLVGHLIGGAIAARFAADQGHVVSRLVLVTPMGLAPFEPTPEFGAVMTGYFAQPTEDTHDQLWRVCVRDLDGLRQKLGETWEILKRYNLDRARAPAVAAAQQALFAEFGMPAIPAADLARIAVPTRLIWGRHDTIVRLAIGEAASRRYGWPLRVLETGNEPAMEAPEAFLRSAFEAPTSDTREQG
ncbi:MAG: alpha/beta fold hydrolase [Actinopolymorphaceae bacterium]